MFWQRGNRGGKRRSASVQEQLDGLTVERARLSLDERVYKNQLLHAAAQRDPVAAAQIAFGNSKRGGASPIVTHESLGDKVLGQLVEKVLSEREDDPAQKIARLRRAALEDRALRRVMADDDDEPDDDSGSMVREVMVALASAVGAGMVPLLAQYAPAVAARLQPPQPTPADPAQTRPLSPGRRAAAAGPSAPAGLPSAPNPVAAMQPPGGNVSALDRLKVRMVLRQLEQRSPEDFAVWALQQPAAEAMLLDLADTPDEDLDGLLRDSLDDPAMAEWRPVLAWLADRPEHARRIVDELRRVLEPEPTDAPQPLEPAELQPAAFETEPRHAVGGL